MDLHLSLGEVFAEPWQVAQARSVDDERVERVADAASAALGVGYDALAHLHVAILVEVAMHHARSRLYDRHLGGISDKADELLSATRYA